MDKCSPWTCGGLPQVLHLIWLKILVIWIFDLGLSWAWTRNLGLGFMFVRYIVQWYIWSVGFCFGHWVLILYQFYIMQKSIKGSVISSSYHLTIFIANILINFDKYEGSPVSCQPNPPPHHTGGRKRFPSSVQERIEEASHSNSEENISKDTFR